MKASRVITNLSLCETAKKAVAANDRPTAITVLSALHAVNDGWPFPLSGAQRAYLALEGNLTEHIVLANLNDAISSLTEEI